MNRVLIVDDDPASRRLLDVRLRPLECDVTTAANGEQALTAIRTDQPVAALLTAPVFFTIVTARQDTRPMEIDPGTYRLRLCAQPCGAESVTPTIATAMLVIFENAKASAEPLRSQLLALGSPRRSALHNACFKVTQRTARVNDEELLFGITPTTATAWSYMFGDGFQLNIYQSIDASFNLRWAEPGPLRRGEGWSLQPGTAPYHRSAYFTAERTGPSDIGQCT